ncbi:MAG: hypothetical protein V8Q82_08465, partial [Christensenellales bacterium]
MSRKWAEQRITTLRANLLKTTPENVASVLSAAGIAYTRWAAEDAAFLLEGADERAVQALPLYERGEIYLELTSMCCRRWRWPRRRARQIAQGRGSR